MNEELIEHMKNCGWGIDDNTGLVTHDRLGLGPFPDWASACKACIEVASEA